MIFNDSMISICFSSYSFSKLTIAVFDDPIIINFDF